MKKITKLFLIIIKFYLKPSFNYRYSQFNDLIKKKLTNIPLLNAKS